MRARNNSGFKFIGSSLAVLVSLVCSLSQAAPEDQLRSLSGVWRQAVPVRLLKPEDGSAIPLVKSIKLLKPESFPKDKLPDAADIKERCSPNGVPRVWLKPYPFQIIEKPDVIAFVYEDRQSFRLVYMNEALPDAERLDPWFFGHSVGRWEGDTLVVESVGFNAETRLDDVLPHSDQLKVTERFRKIEDGRTLELHLTIDDSKTFTRPWTARLTFTSQPNERIAEYICGIGAFSARQDR